MTPEQVAQNFYGECAKADDASPWCNTHEDYWPLLAFEHCPLMTSYIDLVEQAIADYRDGLTEQVAGLRTREPDPNGTGFWNGWDSALINVLGRLRGEYGQDRAGPGRQEVPRDS